MLKQVSVTTDSICRRRSPTPESRLGPCVRVPITAGLIMIKLRSNNINTTGKSDELIVGRRQEPEQSAMCPYYIFL